jgi:hypothetical protein
MPNAIIQLSKYIWALTSFGGIPSTDGFAKRYELHYQPRKMGIDGAEVQGQYGCLNFRAKCGGQGVKLPVAVKNKWAEAWTQAWFYCKVPLLQSPSPGRRKGIYALHSYMTALDFAMEPSFECVDDDANDAAIVKTTRCIGGYDAIEEYMDYGLFPLSASFDLGEIEEGEMTVSKRTLPLLEFPVSRLRDEADDQFRARIELAVKNVVGSYAHREHDACITAVPNEGRLNKVLE